jgi:hypothetical protein
MATSVSLPGNSNAKSDRYLIYDSKKLQEIREITNKVKISVMKRPTASRLVYIGVRHQSGTPTPRF